MPLIAYEPKNFSQAHEEVIANANQIMREYADEGYDLTLRQLYYQFVSRDLLANKDTEYKRLGGIISAARLAGRIDWYSIVDRTRNLRPTDGTWESPEEIIESSARGYRIPYWDVQPRYVEVWIEKDALAGVMDRICREMRIPFFSCRGYTSQSEMWSASQRLGRMLKQGKEVTVLHLGDHDPSGIDMTRDIEERLHGFIFHDLGYGASMDFKLKRIALNMDQIEEYDPPPNPAKLTDSRGRGYVAEYGYESWELDALNPQTLSDLVRVNVEPLIDWNLWEQSLERETREKEQLSLVNGRWDEIIEFLEG